MRGDRGRMMVLVYIILNYEQHEMVSEYSSS